MNTKQIAFNKIAKIKQELSAEKVELAIVDSLDEIKDRSIKAYSDYIDDMDTSKGYLSQAKKKAAKAVELFKEYVRLYEDAESKFKELGLDMPNYIKIANPKSALQITEKDLAMMNSLFSQFKVK